MITRVQIKNYRSLAEIDVELRNLTVLVGRNGTGKSAFLDALRFVRDSLRPGGLEDAILNRRGISSIRRWSKRKPYDILIRLNVQRNSDFWGEYAFVISQSGDSYKVKSEICRVGKSADEIEEEFRTKDGQWEILPETLSRGERRISSNNLVLPNIDFFSPRFARVRRMLSGSFYNIFPNTLREPQKPSERTTLADHADNLASVVKRMSSTTARSNLAELVSALAKVADGASGLRVREVGGYLVTEIQHHDLGGTIKNSESNPWFELAQESDGTLRMLGMLVALYNKQSDSRSRGSLLALEEPENGLHPGALAVLSDVLREAAKRHQILITTQSPDLISRFKASELLVVERQNGTSIINPIDDIQRETIEEQLFSAGDLLRIEGLRGEHSN